MQTPLGRYYCCMQEYTPEALGRVIRRHRESKGLTQEELGKAASYSDASAGVSVSRLESGNLAPRAERLTAIAKELGVTWESLQVEAAARSRLGGDGEGRIDRIRRASAQRDELEHTRAALIAARDRAITEFLRPLRDVAAQVQVADLPRGHASQVDQRSDEAGAEAAYQIQFTREGLLRALEESDERTDFANFTEMVALGAAAAVTAERVLPSPAARRGFLAAMGMAVRPRAGYGGGLLAAVAVGVAAAAVVERQQSKKAKRKTESATRLAEAEAELARTQPNVDALYDVMSRATEAFEYVATHAAHALTRWRDQLDDDPLSWGFLSPDHQRRYEDFVEIAAAVLAIAAIDLQELAGSTGPELENAVALADQLLLQSIEAVSSRV